MRVLIVPKEFPTAGAPQRGIFILRRVQAMQRLGHEMHVLRIVPLAPALGGRWSAYRDVPDEETVEGVPVRALRLPMLPRMAAIEYLPMVAMRAFEREIRRVDPAIVHASFLIPCGQLAVRQRIAPAVVTGHGVDAYGWPDRRAGLRRAAREAVRDASAATAVSGYIASCMERLANRKVRVIWNGADERFFSPRDPEADRRSLGLPNDRPIALFLGNVYREKGVFELADAIAAIPAGRRPLLVVAGSGPGDEAFARRVAHLRIDARLLGRVSHDRTAAVIGACDMLVLPSYAEGLPNVVCEAMLSRRAVVASSVGGVPEILRDGFSGAIVPPRDVPALAAAIDRLSNDDELRERYASAAHAFALEHLTWGAAAKRYEDVYREAAA